MVKRGKWGKGTEWMVGWVSVAIFPLCLLSVVLS